MAKANLQALLDEEERRKKEEAQRRAQQQAAAMAHQREAAKAAVKQAAAGNAAAQLYKAAVADAAQKRAAQQAAQAAVQVERSNAVRKLQQGQKLTGTEADRAYEAVNLWLENDANRAAYDAVRKAAAKGGDWAARLYGSGRYTKQQLDTAEMYRQAYRDLGMGAKLKGRVGDTLAGVGLNVAGGTGLVAEAMAPVAAYQTAAEDAARLGKSLAENKLLRDAANRNTQAALTKVLANENPINKSGWAYQTWLQGQQRQQRGALGLTDAQKMLQGAAASTAENLALAAVNPALVMPVLMMQATGGSVAESAERGDTLAKTLGKATATGAVGALIEKLPADELMKNLGAKPGAAADALTGLLRQAGAEGLEEFAESYASTAIDAAFGDEDWRKLVSGEQLQEAVQAGVQGALAGGMMGGGAQLMSRQAAAQQTGKQKTPPAGKAEAGEDLPSAVLESLERNAQKLVEEQKLKPEQAVAQAATDAGRTLKATDAAALAAVVGKKAQQQPTAAIPEEPVQQTSTEPQRTVSAEELAGYEQQVKDYRQKVMEADLGLTEEPEVPVIPQEALQQMPKELVPQEIWQRAGLPGETKTAPADSAEAEDILQATAKSAESQTAQPKPGTEVWAERMEQLFGGGQQMQQAFEKGAAKSADSGKVRFDERSVLRDDKTAAKLLDINSRSAGLVTEVREKLEQNAYGAVEVQLGRMLVGDDAKQADLVGTLLHEDYHWFSAWNKQGGAELAKSMVEYMAQTHGAETVDALVQDYLDRYAAAGQQLTYAQAVEEMTGDALRGIFDSEKSLRQYIKHCQSSASDRSTSMWNGPQRALKALRDFFDRVSLKLKEYLRIDPDNEAARMASELCEERKEQLRQMYREYMADALDAMEEAEGGEAEQSEPTKGSKRYTFGGAGAMQRGDYNRMYEADRRLRSGESEETVWRDTGWLRGKDGKMRFEIDDSGAKVYRRGDAQFRRDHPEYARHQELTDRMLDMSITPEEYAELRELDQTWGREPARLAERVKNGNATLRNLLDHEALYRNYPHLANVPVRFEPLEGGARGQWDGETIKLNSNRQWTDDQMLSTLLHEVQHAVQQWEDFAGGASPEYWQQRIDRGDTIEDYGTRKRRAQMQWLEAEHPQIKELSAKLTAAEDDAQREAVVAEAAAAGISEEALDDYWMLEWDEELATERSQDPESLYRNTAGEIEARDAAQRKGLTAEERRKQKPNTGSDRTVFAEDGVFSLAIESGFYDEIEKLSVKTSPKPIKVGRTSSVLKSIGVMDRDIYWDSEKILKILSDHPEMTKSVIQQVPHVLEYPVVVSLSEGTENRSYKSRIFAMGDVQAENGKPVLVALELLPTSRRGLKVNSIMVTSAYGKNDAQTILDKNTILYIEPNEKRTKNWLRVNRLQLPLHADQSGPIHKITYVGDSVKVLGKNSRNAKLYEAMKQIAESEKENHTTTRRTQLPQSESGRQAVADRKLGITMAKLADGVYGVDENTRVQRVDEASGLLLRRWNSRTDRRALNDRLGQLFSQNRPAMTEAEAREECRRVAEFVLDGATQQNRLLWDQYPDLHHQTLTVPKDSTLMRELVYKYGSYAEAQKEAGKHGVTLRQGSDAMPWDKLQRELHGEFPAYFDGEAHSGAELLQQMMDAYDNIKIWMENRYAEYYDDAAEELAGQLYKAYEQSEDPNIRSLLESAPADESEEVTALRKKLQDLQQNQQKRWYTGKNAEAMERLKRSWNKLYQMYMRPTETSHIPNVGGLREMTGELLALLDPGSTGVDNQGIMLRSAEEFEAKIKLVQEHLVEAKQSIDRGKNGELGDYLSVKEIAEVREALDTLSDILGSENAYENVTQYSGHTARQMTLEARGACINVMTLLETKIRDANRSLTAGFARDMAKARMEAASEVSSGKVHKLLGGDAATERNAKYTDYLSPQRVFNRLGGYRKNSRMNQLYNLLNDAEVDTESYKQQGGKYFEKLAGREAFWLRPLYEAKAKSKGESTKAAELERFTGKKAEKLVLEMPLIDGTDGKVAVTRAILANMVDVWQHNKAEVEASGFTVPNLQKYYEGKIEDAYHQGTQVYPKKEQLEQWAKICEGGAAADWMRAMTEYEGWITPIKASVQEAVDGFTNIRNRDHRTLYRNADFIVGDSDADMRDSALRHFGFTKYRQKGVMQPIRAMDITDYAAKQVKDDSIYCGMTKAVRDFAKIYDGKLVSDYRDANGRRRSAPSLKAIIGKHYGQTANDYIKNLLQDLKGTPRAGGSPLLDKLMSNLAGSALSMNFYSTPVKQLSGFWAGASVVGMDHILDTVKQKNRKYALSAEEIAKYTPLLAIREADGGNPDLAAMRSKKGRIGTLNEHLFGSWAIGKMDSWVIERMWSAAAAKVHEEHPDLGESTEEFKRATAKVFNRCVQETQSNNLVLQRSEMLRSKNAVYRILGQFKSQPMVNGNLILDAWAGLQASEGRSKEEQAEAKKRFVDTMVSQTATVLTDVALVNLVRAVMHNFGSWKDEDEEIAVGSVLSCLLGDGMGSITGMVPGLDILTDLLSGYDYSNVTTDMVNDLKDAFVDVYKAATDEEMTLGEKVQASIKPLCTGMDAFGIPASSTRRFAEAVGKWIEDGVAGELDISGKADAYGTDLYGELFAQRDKLEMSGSEVQRWYGAFGGKKDSRPTAEKREELTYYENRFEDGGDVDDALTEMYMELFADYSEQGMDARDAHTAAEKVLPAKELTEEVKLPDADNDGEKEEVELNARQIVDYAEAKSEAGYEMYMELFASNYNAEERAEIAGAVDDYADAVALREVFEAEPDDWYSRVFDAIDSGMSELDALAMVLFAGDVEGEKDTKGETVDGSKLQNQLDYLKGQKISNRQKAVVLAGEMSSSQKAVYDKAVKAGVDTWAAAQFVVYRTVTHGDKNTEGKTVTGSELKKEVEYIKKMSCTNNQKAVLVYECLSDAKQNYFDEALKAGADPWVTAQYLVFCATVTSKAKVEAEVQRLGVKGRVAEIYLKAAGY